MLKKYEEIEKHIFNKPINTKFEYFAFLKYEVNNSYSLSSLIFRYWTSFALKLLSCLPKQIYSFVFLMYK